MPPLKKNEKVMLIVIGVALIFFVIMDPYFMIWKDPPVPEGSEKPASQAAAPATSVSTAAKGEEPAGESYYGPTVARERVPMEGWRRDPFVRTRPYLDEVWKLTDLKLGAISVRGKDRYALINSRVMRPGDEIGGMIIDRIERDRVVLSTGGRNYTLTWEK